MSFEPPTMRLGDRVEVAAHHTMAQANWQLAEVIRALSGPEAGGMIHCRLLGITGQTSGRIIFENCRHVDDPLVYDVKRVAGPVYRLIADRREREDFQTKILGRVANVEERMSGLETLVQNWSVDMNKLLKAADSKPAFGRRTPQTAGV